ncbi:MAG TPA: TonB-dependent receptor plug domain-containing protein, partial [Opitutaceae bacterium]|nr:TonB-dependent receptor plug domain-containing protein [Opitutaceae bacterium]
MNRTPHTPLDRTRALLAAGLAALVIATTASGQTPNPDTVRRLQEENAALRKRLAELESVASPTVAPAVAQPEEPAPAFGRARSSTTTTAPRTSTLELEKDVQTLSPFEVSTEKDIGYLKTNSATATRIGMEIQKVPLSISVLSEDFIKDAGIRNLQDVMRYTSSGAGDNRMGIKPPGNSATPSGNITLRGFPLSSRLRNGLNRYSYYNIDTVDRIEVIKGPAAVFFGQGFPGGVINYVTKQPQFTDIPTTFSYSYGGNTQRMGTERYTLDHNAVLSKKAAFRFVGAVTDDVGSQRYEYTKNTTVA